MIRTGFFFALFAVLLIIAPAFGAGDEMKFMQGVVSSFESSSIVLNEKQRVNIAESTAYFDTQGRPSGIGLIGERKWLYVEGAIESDGSITAEKIYSLPGYINKKNRYKYGFMQLP